MTLLVAFALTVPLLGGGDALSRGAHEYQPPRIQALRRTGTIVSLFTLAVATPLAFLYALLVPGGAQPLWFDTPLAGLGQQLAGPPWARGIAGVVLALTAVLLLLPAAHAALTDAEQLLRRLASTHRLAERLVRQHPRFGTYAYATDLAAAAAVLIVLAGSGRVPWIAHAYAVGVGATLLIRLTTLVRLRTRTPGPRLYRVPLNLRLGRLRIAAGLVLVIALASAALLALVAIGDVPAIATCALVGGLVVTLAFGRRHAEVEVRRPRHVRAAAADRSGGGAGPGAAGEPARDGAAPALALARRGGISGGRRSRRGRDDRAPDRRRRRGRSAPSTRAHDGRAPAALAGRRARRALPPPGAPAHRADAQRVRRGRRHDPAARDSSEVYVGESSPCRPTSRRGCSARPGSAPRSPKRIDVRLVIHHHSGRADAYHLGAHPPSLTPGDLDLIHRVWLDAVKAIGPHVHHHDVVRAALTQMEQQLNGPQRDDALGIIRQVARPADELAAAVHARDFSRLRDMVRNRHASDLAAMLTDLAIEDQVVVFRVLPRKDAAAVFEYLVARSAGSAAQGDGAGGRRRAPQQHGARRPHDVPRGAARDRHAPAALAAHAGRARRRGDAARLSRRLHRAADDAGLRRRARALDRAGGARLHPRRTGRTAKR